MSLGSILAALVVLAIVGLIFAFIATVLLDITGLGDTIHTYRISRQERGLPTYERLARAHERAAEEDLARNRTTSARDNLREAQTIRRKAAREAGEGREPEL